MKRLHLDFETRSRCDLLTCGAYRYAEDPSTEVLVVAAKSSARGEPVMSWDMRREPDAGIELLREAIVDGWEIHAFNAQFEWAILKHVCPRQFGLPVPDINRMRCSQAVARRAGLPNNLADVAQILKLADQKDVMGKALIRKFSVPQDDGNFIDWNTDKSFTAGGVHMTASEAFDRFVTYCEQDVRTEIAVAEALHPFRLQGFALDCFLLTARLNDRGVPVDVPALENAYKLYRQHEEELTEKFRRITGLSPTQTTKVLEWCRERGYKAFSLDKASRAEFGSDECLTDECRMALEIRGALSFAAVDKIPAMLAQVMTDGCIRGSFMWCGAQKTWRWTSTGPQWQNMKKPAKSFRPLVEHAYQDIRKGVDLDMLTVCYGDPYEVIASLARYFVRFPDRNMLDADFTSVEAMILPALIDCDRLLEKFRRGEDPYLSTIDALKEALVEKYDVPFEITRDLSKTITLATQFQGGWSAVFTATGNTWERAWCETASAVIRRENPEFGRGWRDFHTAFVTAMEVPGTWIKATRHVSFAFVTSHPFPRMLMRLPSGRAIVMPHPEKNPITMAKVVRKTPDGAESSTWHSLEGHDWDDDKLAERFSAGVSSDGTSVSVESFFKTHELSYWGHTINKQYGRVSTYGGSLLQSATQATGVDLLALGVLNAERAGFEPFFLVHDQCLTPDDGRKDEFERALCLVPEWFRGFPLSAKADSVRSYSKT